MKRRNSRQSAIREIVRAKPIRTQRELVDELCAMGLTCTQATVSRDVADMGLTKPDGVYVLPEDLSLQQAIAGSVTDVRGTDALVVVRCEEGLAPQVASALEGAHLEEVLGCVADTHTVLVVAASPEAAAHIRQLVENLA